MVEAKLRGCVMFYMHIYHNLYTPFDHYCGKKLPKSFLFDNTSFWPSKMKRSEKHG